MGRIRTLSGYRTILAYSVLCIFFALFGSCKSEEDKASGGGSGSPNCSVDQTALAEHALNEIEKFEARVKLQRTADKPGCSSQRIEVRGRLHIVSALSEKSESMLFYIEDGDGNRYSLYPQYKLSSFVSGEGVQISGEYFPCGGEGRLDENPLVVDSVTQSSADALGLSARAPSTIGEQKVLAILVNFRDLNSLYTANDVQSVVFSSTQGAHGYFTEASFNQAWLSGDVAGPYTINMGSSVCNEDLIAVYAQDAAANAGFDLSRYDRFIYVFPRLSTCGWVGLGTVGGAPSESWINGALDLHTVVHELGHNLGLYHSKALSCGTASVGTHCASIEYGDTTDAMGNDVAGHFNAFQKERIGWLGGSGVPPITLAQTNGTFTLDAYETNTLNPKAIKIPLPRSSTGTQMYYYVEYRQAIGFDNQAFMSIPAFYSHNLTSGVVVHRGTENRANSSFLLNMNPTFSSWYKAALAPGQKFHDPASGITIILSSATSALAEESTSPRAAAIAQAVVQVEFGPITESCR